jgi:hypothetical protein
LAARACFLAADALARAGQQAEAARLYRDILDNYAHTPTVSQATQRLSLLTGTASTASPEPAKETSQP